MCVMRLSSVITIIMSYLSIYFLFFFFLMIRRPPRSTLFPYTTLYYAKLENLQPVGAFKVRGGVNLVGNEFSTGSVSDRVTLITASTGNHGQSIAYAGRLFGTRVIIYAPCENVNESKVQAMRDLGAEVRLHGRDFDEARLECERVAHEEGFRYVHSANEPKLIAGVGTIG